MTTFRHLEVPGVAWTVIGPEVIHHYECWDGDPIEEETGMVIAVMIGDNRKHIVDPDDLVPIEEDDYCAGCGQIGCGHG